MGWGGLARLKYRVKKLNVVYLHTHAHKNKHIHTQIQKYTHTYKQKYTHKYTHTPKHSHTQKSNFLAGIHIQLKYTHK